MLILSPVQGGGVSMAPIVANLMAALEALETATPSKPKAAPRKPRTLLTK